MVLSSYQDINGNAQICSNSEEIGSEKIEDQSDTEYDINKSIIYEKLTLIKHLYDKLIEQNLDSVLQVSLLKEKIPN